MTGAAAFRGILPQQDLFDPGVHREGRRSGQHGALPELEQRIADTETQLHRLERNAQEQAACAAELRQTDAELQTVTEQMNAARQRQRRAALSSMGEEKSNLRTLEQTLEQARRDAAARRTALEQTHFGVQTPDEAGETAERDALRKEYLADMRAAFKQQLDSTYVQTADGAKIPYAEYAKLSKH